MPDTYSFLVLKHPQIPYLNFPHVVTIQTIECTITLASKLLFLITLLFLSIHSFHKPGNKVRSHKIVWLLTLESALITVLWLFSSWPNWAQIFGKSLPQTLVAKVQCISKWFAVSSPVKHSGHPFTIICLLFLNLSMVRVFCSLVNNLETWISDGPIYSSTSTDQPF